MYENVIRKLLDIAGITLNGNKSHDIIIRDSRTFRRIIRGHSLGLGESYMDGWWDCECLDEFFTKILRANLNYKLAFGLRMIIVSFSSRLFNLQTIKRSKQVAERHYDLGNELYSQILDPTMTYSCGYWKDASNLNQAQLHKLDLICRKLELKPGETLLDIGCGWGGLAKYAAEKYGVEVTGITISQEQYNYAKKITSKLPVNIILQDYRETIGTFDKVVSVGMFEHVGIKNYKEFFQIANKKLKDQGLFLLHTIGDKKSDFESDQWLGKYIFPNGKVPSMKQFSHASEGVFLVEDFHNFGLDYDKTLMAWHENFNKNWGNIKHKYDEIFFRMWNYYLLMCAATFRARNNQLWQIVMSKPEREIGYVGVR